MVTDDASRAVLDGWIVSLSPTHPTASVQALSMVRSILRDI
jgi:hypothetical protein